MFSEKMADILITLPSFVSYHYVYLDWYKFRCVRTVAKSTCQFCHVCLFVFLSVNPSVRMCQLSFLRIENMPKKIMWGTSHHIRTRSLADSSTRRSIKSRYSIPIFPICVNKRADYRKNVLMPVYKVWRSVSQVLPNSVFLIVSVTSVQEWHKVWVIMSLPYHFAPTCGFSWNLVCRSCH